METSDDDPHQVRSTVDTNEFFFEGYGLSVLLIHGLSGTPYEMRYLGERLAGAGLRVCGVRLAGHAGPGVPLAAVGHEAWYESVVAGFERLRRYGDPNIVIGLSAGALLGARLAIDQREDVAGLVMLSPAFFLSRMNRFFLRAAAILGPLLDRIYLRSPSSDIHDNGARSVHPSSPLMPLSAPLELLNLSLALRPELHRITQPTLIIHARNDHTCPHKRNVGFLIAHLASEQKRTVILEQSFHVVTVDSEKERVASEVLEFAVRFRGNPQRAQA